MFYESPSLKKRLPKSSLEELNTANLHALNYLVDDISQKQKIEQLAYEKVYTREAGQAIANQMAFVCQQFDYSKEVILDIASGTGRLANELIKNTDMNIVHTDISYYVLKQSRNDLSVEYKDRVSYIALDINYIPFQNQSVSYLITFLGLQNLNNFTNAITELKRVSSGSFYVVCMFCSPDDWTNLEVLIPDGLDSLFVKNKLTLEFEKLGMTVECLNSISANVKPTPWERL